LLLLMSRPVAILDPHGRPARLSIRNYYEAAKDFPYRSHLQGQLQDARYDLSPTDRKTLQKRSRYFERNSGLINVICDRYEMYTVGPGLQLYPASRDDAWNLEAYAHWAAWKPFADLTSRQNFDILQGIIARAQVIDGEIFTILTSEPDNGRPRLQLIEAHNCATPDYLSKEEGKTIIDGVQINNFGRPVGYWFRQPATTYDVASRTTVESFEMVDATSVVHIFEPGRTGEYRGRPLLAPVLKDQHDLDDLQLLEMKAARDAAEISNVIENETGEASVDEYQRTGGDAAAMDDGEYQARCRYYKDAIGGRTHYLKRGDSYKQFQSTRPSVVTRDYWTSLEEKVCAGAGIPRQLIYPESLQGTVERSVLDMANTWFRCRSTVLVEHFKRIYRYVLAYGNLTERLLQDPPFDWRLVTWCPPRAVNVDVGRNSQAMIAELAAGLRTYQDIYAELGQDYRVKLKQRADEVVLIKQLAAERGIEPDEIASAALPAPPPTAPASQELEEMANA
jgi:lambda family phage portal protein